jgi:hypothetical protein
MFVQVIQGKLADPDYLNRQVQKWRKEIKPLASGYLGATSGVTADNYSIAIVRFESEAAAQTNNSLPEQSAWWEETSKAFSGQVEFHDCREVDLLFDGGKNDAGFVQVIQGRALDQERFRAESKRVEGELRKLRPDLIGGLTAWHGDGTFTDVAYFTSEAEARKNEKGMEGSPLMEEYASMFDGEPTFYDLKNLDFD